MYKFNGTLKYHSEPSAFAISSSDFPLATAISTKALEIASLVPSYIISGVTSTSSDLAIPLTLSKFGLDPKAEVILLRDC
jgi:hypothetical protein